MRPHPLLPLPLLLSLRTHLGGHRSITAVTILAIAMSVALASGLEMSSRSVESELMRTADELAGAAQIEVTGGALGIPERLLETVSAVSGVRVAAPLVQATFRIVRDAGGEIPLHVLGVDLLADPGVRTYAFAGKARVADPLRLIAGSDSVLVSEALAKRLGLEPGEEIALRSGRARYAVTVRGILEAGGVADAFGGQVAVMDVYSLQTLLGREGWLDRIDVVVATGAASESVTGAIAGAVAGVASVRRSAARDFWVENTLATLRMVVSALVLVAILVASLLAYGAMSLFADRRTHELALLQLAGLEPRRVRRFLYLDALLLALVGSALGLFLGLVFSRSFLSALSWVSDFLQGVEIEEIELRASTLALSLVVGVVVALVGVVEPARRVSALSPLEVLLGARGPNAGPPRLRRHALVLTLLSVAAVALAVIPIRKAALAQVGLLLAAGVAALAVAARDPIPRGLRRLRPALEAALPGLGRLLGASLVARPAQTAIAVACLGGVVSGVTVSLALVRSVASTLDVWTESQFRGGILVTAGTAFAIRAEEPILPETVEIVRETPGVRALFDHVTATILYQGEEVLLGAGSMAVLAQHGRLPVVNGDPREIAERAAHGEIVISDGFARHFRVGTDDSITLDTPQGPRTFRVAGVMRDYAGPSGSLNLDLAVFDALWSRKGSRDLVLWMDRDPALVIPEIERRVAERQTLFFVYGDALATFASHLLGRAQRLLQGVAGMTAVLGAIAVLNLLLGAVAARARELALFLSVGATQRQVALLVAIDGLLIGSIAGVGGIALGVACSYPIVSRVLPEALGWSLSFSVDLATLTLLAAGVALTSLAAAVYPARLAARTPMRDAFAPE